MNYWYVVGTFWTNGFFETLSKIANHFTSLFNFDWKNHCHVIKSAMHFQVVLFIVTYSTILWDFSYCLILCIALSLWHSKPLNFWLQFKQRQRLLLLSWYWVMFKMILFWVNWNWPYKVNFLSLVFQDARHLSQGKKSISFQWLCKIWSSFFDNMVVLDLWKYHLLLNHKSVIFHLFSHVSTCIEKQYLLMLILESSSRVREMWP